MENMTVMGLMKISIMMPVLFICSIVMIAYMFERFIAYQKVGTMDATLAERIKQYVRQGQIKEAIGLCSKNSSFVAHAVEVALNAANFPREEMESIFNLYRMRLQALLNKRLSLFGTLAFTGPLLGLLGTVLGVIRAFRDLALSGSGGPTIVAAGIAEALITTAGGIFVAVISALLYNWFTAISRGKVQQFDQLTQELAILVYTGNAQGRK
jgi:biopolymer transport protein ExbB